MCMLVNLSTNLRKIIQITLLELHIIWKRQQGNDFRKHIRIELRCPFKKFVSFVYKLKK